MSKQDSTGLNEIQAENQHDLTFLISKTKTNDTRQAKSEYGVKTIYFIIHKI